MTTTLTKTCVLCRKTKPLDFFLGQNWTCKKCLGMKEPINKHKYCKKCKHKVYLNHV